MAFTSEFVIEVTLPEVVKQSIYNDSVIVPQKKRQAQSHTSIARYPAQTPSSGSELAALKYYVWDIQSTSTYVTHRGWVVIDDMRVSKACMTKSQSAEYHLLSATFAYTGDPAPSKGFNLF